MGKWAKYKKKYCKEWEKENGLKEWIRSVPGNDEKAYCRFCKSEIRAHHGDLVAHGKTEKHKRNQQPFSASRTLFSMGCRSVTVDESLKSSELKLAAHIACHSSINTIDHLGELVNDVSGKDINLHRTKCTALVNRVLGPCLLEEVLDDMKRIPYSLIIDESTDIGNEKQLCILARYYSAAQKQIVTSFLGLLSIVSGTAESIFQALQSFLVSKKLDIKDCMGLATDGCNTMCGRNNSVITKFREVCPNIIHIKCICHSIQLCSSHSLKVMPRNIEFMVSETYNWFSHSTLRQQKYHELYSAMNVGEIPLKILRLSGTRWLSISACVDRIIDQFHELKLHFQIAKDEERNYTAELLYQMYTDKENKLYLVFLQPILKELNRVNKIFQAASANPLKLLSELMNLYRALLCRVMKPVTFTSWLSTLMYDIDNENNHLPLCAVDFGASFQITLAETQLTTAQSDAIKVRCRSYLLELLKQMKERLPSNVERLESLSELIPSIVLGRRKQALEKVTFLPLFRGELAKLDQQYSHLGAIQWPNRDDEDVEQFWIDVATHTDACGDQDFEDLGKFMLSILALPFSNAAVERTFSQMALLKYKLRNRMGQSLLENLLHVRSHMAMRNICCNSFTPSSDMLARFTNEIYRLSEPDSDAQ